MVEIAAAAGLSAETLRKIETGRIATPALFTVAALADVLDLSLDVVVSATAHEGTCDPRSGTTALPNAITDIRTRSAAEH
jgi:transcriptional regulator with XRE-family HTH domain